MARSCHLGAVTCANTVVMGEVQDLEYTDTCICFFQNGAYHINFRSRVKRPARRLVVFFGSEVYKIRTLDLEAA